MNELWKQIFQYGLAALIFGALVAVIILLIVRAVPQENKDAILILVGVLASAFTAVIGFFFGSSKNSQAKDDMLNKKLNGH